MPMASSADRVRAFNDRYADRPAYWKLEVDGSLSAVTLGDLRALQAERDALWAVVRAGDRMRDRLLTFCTTHVDCKACIERTVFDQARAALAALEKE